MDGAKLMDGEDVVAAVASFQSREPKKAENKTEIISLPNSLGKTNRPTAEMDGTMGNEVNRVEETITTGWGMLKIMFSLRPDFHSTNQITRFSYLQTTKLKLGFCWKED
jgi:RNA binding exosome subunit